jgi:hypothetical protein
MEDFVMNKGNALYGVNLERMIQEKMELLKKLDQDKNGIIREITQLEKDLAMFSENNLDRNIGQLISSKLMNFEGINLLRIRISGMLPHRIRDKNLEQAYTVGIMKSLEEIKEVRFSKAFISINHYFANQIIRDVDNRNRNVVLNALRYAGLIPDDNWKFVTIMETGYLNKGDNFVDVIVLEERDMKIMNQFT